jgi:hypothetical protein
VPLGGLDAAFTALHEDGSTKPDATAKTDNLGFAKASTTPQRWSSYNAPSDFVTADLNGNLCPTSQRQPHETGLGEELRSTGPSIGAGHPQAGPVTIFRAQLGPASSVDCPAGRAES